MQDIRTIGRRLAAAAMIAGAAASLVNCSKSTTTPSNNSNPPAAALQSLTLNPTTVTGGGTVQGTVTLSAAAPSGGATVTLVSSNTAVATVPPSVVVLQGSPSATFTVTSLAIASNGTSDIAGNYLSATQKATLTVTAGVHADFVVTPDTGTTVSVGQCSASQVSGTATQKLLCTFDATASTPGNAITEYRWTLPGATTSQLGVKLIDPIIPCGGFSSAGSDRSVTLQVTAPGGSNSVTKTVTFIKGAPC